MDKNQTRRYEFWLAEVEKLAKKFNLTTHQTVIILNEINVFNKLYTYKECDYFINHYIYTKIGEI